MAAIKRAISIFEGAFSSRDIVGCEHRGSPLSGGLAHRHLEDRIVAQRIAIVGVFVAGRDREHPKPQHLRQRVLDAFGLAPVPDARSQPVGQAKLPLHAAQQKNARVRRKLPAIEAHAQFLARNRWKIEWKWIIFAHDGCGAPQSIDEFGLATRIMNRMAALRYIRRSIP